MRLAIIGGGGFRVPLIYRALSSGRFAGLVDELIMHDVDDRRLAGIAAVLADMPGPGPALRTTTDLDDALATADVIFAAIRPGGAGGRVLDERIAMAHGLLGQETVGAGGIAYALRSLPPMLHIAHRLRELNPDAWLIDFTNPAGIITQALSPVLRERVIGICDSPVGLVRRAQRALGLPQNELAGVDYLGLNHLGWLRALTDHDDVDRLPELLADDAALAGMEEGRVFGAELLRLLGCIPNEYLFYFYDAREARLAMAAAEQTRGESIAAGQAQLYGRLADSTKPFELWEAARLQRESGYLAEARSEDEQRDEADLAGGGYEAVALAAMAAVVEGEPAELIVNVRNARFDGERRPAIVGLPDDAVVEVPCRVDTTGATPLHPGAIPSTHQLGLMSSIKAVEESVIDAVIYRDRDAAQRAFTLHPLIDSAAVANRLLTDYEDAHPSIAELFS